MVQKWPPIDPGTKVRTTEANLAMREEWPEDVWHSRQWGVEGEVVTHHDSHGLCYEVRHPDGTIGGYDPSELRVIPHSTGIRPQLAVDIAESHRRF